MKWNAAVVVTGLVEAGSEDEAVAVLEGKVREAGFDPYSSYPYPNAFESEG